MEAPQERFIQIDGLRGIAAASVVLYHLVTTYNNEYSVGTKIDEFFGYGFYGVELFFLISGFVIYYTLVRSNNAMTFLKKRFIRLFPTYWLCLIMTFLVVSIFPLSEARNSTWMMAVVNLTMLNGLVGVKAVDPSYWSLQIELFFYFLMATVLAVGSFPKINWFLWIWVALILFYNFLYKIPVAGTLFNLRYGPLFISGICFYKIKIEEYKGLSIAFLLAASFVVTLYTLQDLKYSVYAITIIYVVFGLAIFVPNRILSSKALVFLGKISYPLYLVHQNIGFVILNGLRSVGLGGSCAFAVPILFAIVIAYLITKYFEPWAATTLKRVLL